ncbi:putative uncharacterized protein [Bacteroides sp. CAG:530]|nr:putative uncharacterized protein [Bacteroides sp. CAG:530]
MNKMLYCILSFIALLYIVNGYYAQSVTLFVMIGCFIRGKKQVYLYNPYYILIATLISFLLYIPTWGGVFFPELSNLTQLTITFSFIALFLGISFGINNGYAPLIRTYENESVWIMMTLGLLQTVVVLVFFGNVLALSGDALLDAKQGVDIPIIGQLAYYLPASIIIACKRNNSKLIIITIAISLFAALITVTKMSILVSFFFIMVGFIRFKPNIIKSKIGYLVKKYAIIWLPILILYMFSNNNSIRTDAQGGEMSYFERSGSQLSSDYQSTFAEGMFLNYLYLSSPWGNLDYNIRNNHERGYGANTFAQFGNRIGIQVETVEKIQPTFLNTHSFLTDYVIDFGTIGAIFASFVLGWFIAFCYSRYGCSNDPIWLAFYGLISFATFMLYFSNHFNNGYILNYFLSFGLYYLISKYFSNAKQQY